MKNMSLLELIPIVMALHIWVEEFAQKKIIFHTDNAALVSIINKRSSKDKLIMKFIRYAHRGGLKITLLIISLGFR
jgi:hypothetical protein